MLGEEEGLIFGGVRGGGSPGGSRVDPELPPAAAELAGATDDFPRCYPPTSSFPPPPPPPPPSPPPQPTPLWQCEHFLPAPWRSVRFSIPPFAARKSAATDPKRLEGIQKVEGGGG